MKKNACCYRLEQLAHLGLPQQIFIPSFLQELHHNMSLLSCSFLWQNNESLTNIFDEKHNGVNLHELIQSISHDKSNTLEQITSWLCTLQHPIKTTDIALHTNSVLSEFYNAILLPLNYQISYLMPVFESKTTTKLGILLVHRRRDQPDFSENECRQLTQVATYISHGLSHSSKRATKMIDGWDQGLLILEPSGQVKQACNMGRKLLSLASNSQLNTETSIQYNIVDIFDKSVEFIRNIRQDIDHRNSCINPTLTHTNAWGEFKLRGFLIHDHHGTRQDQIGVNIRWQEPFVLKLFHKIKILGLTPRQETVALLYAIGDPYKIIASKLNLSTHTVKEHIKNIHELLNTSSRTHLIELILCDHPMPK